MYLNKAKRKALEVLVLRMKVASKHLNTLERGTSLWHETWNRAEYSHRAIEALLGDTHAAEFLNSEDASEIPEAQEAVRTMGYYGVNI